MEFELIRQYFSEPFLPLLKGAADRIPVGIGDDCAVLRPRAGHELYISTDTSVAGVHFFPDQDAHSVGWKCLAVNLSDLAAKGATPLAFTLNLSVPKFDPAWLAAFSQGLLAQAQAANCPLVGGDTTSSPAGSPVVVSITVWGERPAELKRLGRDAAHPGDELWVTGVPGLARLALLGEMHRRAWGAALPADDLALIESLSPFGCQQATERLLRPVVRAEFAQQASGHIHACLDLSDGLSGDLQHLASASRLDFVVEESALIELWQRTLGAEGCKSCSAPMTPAAFARLPSHSLQGGDDYELCFTAAPSARKALLDLALRTQTPLMCLGAVRACDSSVPRVVFRSAEGTESTLRSRSFDHFGVLS